MERYAKYCGYNEVVGNIWSEKKMSNDYTLKFDLSSYDALDEFALLADQQYNLGDKGDWFGCFRGGLYGLYARVVGVQIHYHKVHSWEPVIRTPSITEYHLSSILFNMDSAIKCMVFALNALGYIADPTQFLDVTNEQKLNKISPRNILGKPPAHSSGLRGYDNYFPSLKSYWHENRELIYTISEQHDVSKHRSTIFLGGKVRNDPPPMFFEKLGIAGDNVKESLFCPMAEIILEPEPKIPRQQRRLREYKDIDKLENIAERFSTFINTCGVKALEDAKSKIKLNYYEFIKNNTSSKHFI
jgi:hypothetical protein